MTESDAKIEETMQALSVLVVGTGAIGAFYGGKLAQAGAAVSVMCRSDYEVVRAHGITVESTLGNFHFKPIAVVRHAREVPEPPQVILVATKVIPDVVDVSALIAEAVGPETAIFLIQNGIGIEDPVAGAFLSNEIISGLAFICVTRTALGHIVHQDFGRLTLGCYPKGTSRRTQTLAQLFASVGVPCEESVDIVTDRWRKLVWNAAFNPISVLGGGLNTREILESAGALKLVRRIMEEVCLLAEADGHPLPPGTIEANIEGTRAMKPYKTSMLLDFEARRPMEIEAILGNALRAARHLGVSVEHLEVVYVLLRLADVKNRLG